MKLFRIILPAIIFHFVLFSGNIDAQFKSFHASAYLGYGAINGNSPAQESLFGSLIVGTGHEILGDVELRVGYLYARKITYFLPEDRTNKYYPFIHSFSLKGFMIQTLKGNYFLEEGIGLILINDRTFSDVNVWDTGMGANAVVGADLTDTFHKGFKIGLGLEFAVTFTNTTASYYLFNLQSFYYF